MSIDEVHTKITDSAECITLSYYHNGPHSLHENVNINFDATDTWLEHLEKYLDFLTRLGYQIPNHVRDRIMKSAEMTLDDVS